MHNHNFITEDFKSVVLQSDTLFTDIDKKGDHQISLQEFEAYVKRKNPDEADQKQIMKEFLEIDLDHDGQL